MIRYLVAVSALLLPVASTAAPVTIDVRAADGTPMSGAVVTVETPKAAPPVPRGLYQVEQRDIAFQPHVLIVPVGAMVGFPNRDKVRHHVYSFSKPKKFDLKLFGREDARTVVFDKPGVVALGCNIHDVMNGVVFVTAAPFAGTTSPAGRVAFASVPAGTATVRVWHPSIRAPGNALSQAVTIAPAGYTTTFAIRH